MNTVITSRDTILSVSREMAASRGLNAINMRAVAVACGVSVGSLYNYFPSKADLIAAIVEDVWKEIFMQLDGGTLSGSFVDYVKWIFETAKKSREYPDFFLVHSISFSQSQKPKGKEVMDKYFMHMKKGLLAILETDEKVREYAFSGKFTTNAFVDFVFSNMLTALVKGEDSFDVLEEMIIRSIY